MTRINVGYLLAFGLLGTAAASPKPIAVPQSQQEIDPNPSLTYSMRDPEVTNFETQNATATTSPSSTGSSSTAGGATGSASTPLTQIAAFTAPNGGMYTATVIDGTMQIAGYILTVGGPEYLVGGVRVSAASGGLKYGDSTAAYAKVTGQATTEVVSTSTDASGSTQVVSSSATVPVAASTSASGSRSSSGSTSASSSASASGAASTGSAAAGVTAKSRSAVLGLAGIAVLACVFA